MSFDFSNTNTLWASVLAATLARLGLKAAVISPGSRSTPLTVALASHPNLEVIPVLDERSAAFFALGLARRTGLPVALVCTSGTAGANYYPALIEARESRIPLLVLPPIAPRNCGTVARAKPLTSKNYVGLFPSGTPSWRCRWPMAICCATCGKPWCRRGSDRSTRWPGRCM
jgi:2-succinyl-5-enolpyruvyl-6-hydroxy-3-cyclohexene-1-carboxylate synthase